MFKKIFIFFLIFTSSVFAEVVKELNVKGNDRISTETIKVYGDIEIGKNYTKDDINSILKNLYSTNFFEDVSVTIINNTLNINLKEYPIINSIELQGEKSTSLKNSILEKLSLKTRESFILSELSSDAELIKKLYASVGYNFTNVKTKIEKFSNNRVNILYIVEKGNRTFIKKIKFTGDKRIKEGRLRDVIASEEKKFWKFLSQNTYYNKSNIELDKRLLLNYYKSLGYYDVQVLSDDAQLMNKEFIELTYTINSGNRYRINKINTNVIEPLEKKLFLNLENEYKKLIGKYYSPFKVTKLLEELDRIIASNDIQFVQHSVNEILNQNEIELRINIYEGKKEIVEKINIFGNNITEESVIRAELLLDEGDPFSPLKFEKSIAKIKSRNIFGSVTTNISDGSSKDQKILNINVEEKPTGEISAGAGIGTNGGSFSFNIKENNWLGKGYRIETLLDVSSENLTGQLSVTDPNYNFTGNAVEYFVSSIKDDKPKSGYKNTITNTGIGLKFEQFKDIYLAPKVSFSYDKLQVDNNASSSLKKQKGEFTELIFDYGIITDKRDKAYSPTEGFIASFNQSLPIFADSPFLKNTLSLSKYLTLSKDVIGAYKFYASSVTGLNNKDVRLNKRISVGNNRLRGFERGQVGPKDGEDYIGGNYAVVNSFEINLPKLLPESTKTDIGLYIDVGNLWGIDYDSSLDESNKLRSSAGINTSWLSPVGPMSFVFSKNLSKADTDITENFNFRLGTTF